MDKKLRIVIPVGESKYPLWVDPSEEPIYREAGRMISRRLIAYRTKFRGTNLPSEDYLAMAAIDLAAAAYRLQLKGDAEATETAVADIVADLQDFLVSGKPE